jgi:hypothetical protein
MGNIDSTSLETGTKTSLRGRRVPLITELLRKRTFWETRRQPDVANPLHVVNLPSVEPYGARL